MRLLVLIALAACRPDAGLTKFNATPDAAVLSPADGDSRREGYPLALRGTASDADDNATTLLTRWFVDGVLTCEGAPDADGITACEATVPARTTAEVRLEVTDPAGATDAARITLDVQPDAAPTLVLQSPVTDGAYWADGWIELNATVTDAEDAPASLLAWWDVDGVEVSAPAAPSSDGSTGTTLQLPEGPHLVTAHARDSHGNEAAARVGITIGPVNTDPECGITLPADEGVSASGERMRFEGWADDAQTPRAALEARWTSSLDGALGASFARSDGSVALDAPALSLGRHDITLEVLDERGARCTARMTWRVGTPPILVVDSPADGTVVNEGTPLGLDASASDPDDAPGDLVLAWESDLDGELAVGSPDAMGRATHVVLPSRGTHVLTVRLSDTEGLTATDVRSFTVNGLPTAPGVTLLPSAPLPGDALTCAVSVASLDPEGDTVAYAFAWTVDGVAYAGASAGATESVVAAGVARAGSTWRCEVTPADPWGAGPAAAATIAVADDLDGDGWGVVDGDCDDGDARVSPGRSEVCGDGIDNDCDSSTGDGGEAEVCNGIDDDCDGVVDDVSGYVTTQAEADALAECTELDGLYVHVAPDVVTIDLPALERIDGPLYFHQAGGLETVSMPSLTEVTGYVYFHQDLALTDVDLGALTTVGEYVYFHGNTALARVDLDSLTTVGRYLYVSNNTALTTLDLGALGTVGDYVYFASNSAWCVPGRPWSSIATTSSYVAGNLCD